MDYLGMVFLRIMEIGIIWLKFTIAMECNRNDWKIGGNTGISWLSCNKNNLSVIYNNKFTFI